MAPIPKSATVRLIIRSTTLESTAASCKCDESESVDYKRRYKLSQKHSKPDVLCQISHPLKKDIFFPFLICRIWNKKKGIKL